MSIYDELSKLKERYFEFKESLYLLADDPYIKNNEPFLASEPDISKALFDKIEEILNYINDDLGSDLISEILEYFGEDSSISRYINFDSESFEEDLVNEQPDPYEENLAGYQEAARYKAYEIKSELWNDAHGDVVDLLEKLFPKLLGE